jgi:hypothetical protein
VLVELPYLLLLEAVETHLFLAQSLLLVVAVAQKVKMLLTTMA